MHITDEKYKQLLIESGMVDEKMFTDILDESFRTGQPIGSILIGRSIMSEKYLTELLQSYFGCPMVDLKKVEIVAEVLEMIPEAYAKSKGVLLFAYDAENKLAKVAMLDPMDYGIVEFLRTKLDAWVEAYLTTESSLKYGLKFYKKKIGEEFNQIIEDNIRKSLTMAGERDLSKLAEAVPIISILDSVIEHAVSLGASDIHFEPLEKNILVRFRIDGVMHEILSLPLLIAPMLAARVKVLANLLIDEHKMPQDGRFRFEMDDVRVDLRVNVMPVFHGEKVEMRILRSTVRAISLEDLGLSEDDSKLIKEEISKPHGMVLSTGPTGHGKTTTLYAILHILNTPAVNITTIEDPIEYEVSRVNQTQVNVKAGITFANGLRSLMRQNPDIIMVGEIRDNETVDIAVHASLTGHLVLSTLHTNDAPSAIPRLVDMGAQPFLLSSTLNLVIGQRLVRKICTSCIESYPTPTAIKNLITSQLKMSVESEQKRAIPDRLFRGRGCKICGMSGYRDQIGIFEIMKVSAAIRELILKNAPTSDIRKQAIKEGMRSLFLDGLDKVEKGITSIEEIIRVVRE